MTMTRGVVYTTSLASRDAALPQVQHRIPGADYICFADPAALTAHRGNAHWELRAARPSHDCPVRAARSYKCCPHDVLPGYDWWIWVDGNATLHADLQSLLRADLTLLSHPADHTLQTEFDTVRRRYRAAPSLVAKQYAAYVEAGIPLDTPVPQTSVLARRNVGWVCALNATWWQHIERYTPRDQLSIVPALIEHEVPLKYRPWSSACPHLFSLNYSAHAELAYTGYQHQLVGSDVAAATAGAAAWYRYARPDGTALPAYRFTHDWTGGYAHTLAALAASGFKPSSLLEIGVYEGRGAAAAVAALPSLRSWTGIDPWHGPAYSPARDNAEWNLRQFSRRHGIDLRIFDTTSDLACRQLRAAGEQFDMVYIDGNHEAAAVLDDSRHAWALVRPGGVVVWDDIPWTPEGRADTPVRTGLEQFLQEVGLSFTDAAFNGWQCHLAKPA